VTSEAGRVFGEPPDELDETWVHGMLVGGMAAEPDQLTLARAYADAASHLIDPALASGEPWRLCYPILYLYRHALELYLKTALPPSRRPRHDLRPLLRQFETLLHDQLGVVIPDHVLDDLRTLATIDPDAQGFRYTHTREGHSQFLPGEYWVSLRDLQRFMEVVFRDLERCSGDSRGSSLTAGRGPSARTLGVRSEDPQCERHPGAGTAAGANFDETNACRESTGHAAPTL
jgi:hypothetical protein